MRSDEALLVDLARRLAGRVPRLLRRGAVVGPRLRSGLARASPAASLDRRVGLFLKPALQPARALGEALLIAGQPAPRVGAFVAAGRLALFGRDGALLVGELPRLELHVAHRAPALVGLRALHLLLELLQLLQRAAAARARLSRILPPQVARRASIARDASRIRSAALCWFCPAPCCSDLRPCWLCPAPCWLCPAPCWLLPSTLLVLPAPC